MTDSLTITKIEAKNVLKFVDFEVSPKKITIFRGANDQGKTTALRLAELALKGSTNPHVIHQGAERGEITVEFSDGLRLRRSFTQTAQYAKVTDTDGRIIPSPQKFLDALLGEHQFNPIAWLELEPKEQIRVLLKAIHVRITPDEFTAATGYPAPKGIDYGRHGLEVLADLREYFATDRRVEGQTADRKKKAAAEARAGLPPTKPAVDPDHQRDAVAAVEAAQRKLGALEARQLAARDHDRAVERKKQEIARAQKEDERIEGEIGELQKRIARLREQQEQTRRTGAELAFELRTLSATAPPSDEEIAAANAEIDAARRVVASLDELERIADRFAEIEALDAEADQAAIQVSVLDAVLKTITHDLPRTLMAKASLPVGSLSIEGGKILIDGQDLQFQATSKQIEIALTIARALNPKLKVICVDGFEALDAERRATFIRSAAGDGYSYLISEVDPAGGPLHTETIEETAEVANV